MEPMDVDAGDVAGSSVPIDKLASEIEDITSFDLRTQVQRFLISLNVTSGSPKELSYVPQSCLDTLRTVFLSSEIDCASNSHLLEALSKCLAIPGLLERILEHLGPLLKDFLARWFVNVESLGEEELERKMFVLGEMAELLPSAWSIIHAFLERTPFLRGTPLHFLSAEKLAQSSPSRLQLLLLSYYRLLNCDSYLPDRNAWNAAPLVQLYTSYPDICVRYMALQTYVAYKGIQERVRLKMEKKYIGDMKDVDVEIAYGWVVEVGDLEDGKSTLEMKTIDGWLIRLWEHERVKKYCRTREKTRFATLDLEQSSGRKLKILDLSSQSAIIAGCLCFTRGIKEISKGALDELHADIRSHKPALRSLVDLLAQRLPILITSSPSAGKTHTIRHLASLLYPQTPINSKILTISLADTSIDAKALIGNYVSSPREPGTFTWAEGALVKAMRAGRWLILEDMDKATLEVQSLFARLADSLSASKTIGARATLDIPGKPEPVEASHEFAIIATRNIVGHGVASPPSFLGSHHYQEVQLAEPSEEEVQEILCKKFPTLAGSPISILLGAYQDIKAVTNDSQHRSGRSARPYGLRDLERWCRRVTQVISSASSATTHTSGESVVFSNPVVQEEVFLEAYDVFLASLDTSQGETRIRKEAFGKALAEAIGLNDERFRWLMDARVPNVEVTGDRRARQAVRARVGRATLHGLAPRPPSPTDSSRPFAMTKPSALLLERIAVGVNSSEPLLLVGETGTGKTTAVQHLADSLNKPLTVLNLSMQTEAGDLLGGFKPIEASVPARELHNRWVDLFRSSFSRKKNEKFEVSVRKALTEGRWKRVAEMLVQSGNLAREKLAERLNKRGESPEHEETNSHDQTGQEGSQRKRRKLADDEVSSSDLRSMIIAWDRFLPDADDFVAQHVSSQSRLVFAFLEGPLVKCLRNGEWLLLDEVNLASQETLESLSAVLESSTSSVILTEKGDLEPIPRHGEFRIFACMNPATDVGKKDLPAGLRARFTEVYVPPPDDDRDALLSIVKQYLGDATAGDPSLVLDVSEFYVGIKTLAQRKQIVDGTNTPPHYSMRTLARALTFAVDVSRSFGVRRGLWEGCMMTFTMSLDESSAKMAKQLCDQCLLRGFRNANAVLSQIPAAPAGSSEDTHIRLGHYWLGKGREAIPSVNDYIITPSVQSKLLSLARTILTRKYPVLIQGPTSSGKTSAVEYLARQTGHKFIRINNHEHTDIQEYLGSYAADPESGKLVFQEGALVTAVRNGYWIVLDELNLAPTDVLEALNRLLDDNRELVLPETQEVVKPHPHFMLFATQNPPGLYAGRKVLSRAFRNRFLEVHFEDVPKEELETIICQRCKIAPSYAHRIVQVFEELRHRRQATRVFESNQSFATLRDLFRWANRDAGSYQELAEQGYMLLAERSRSTGDKAVVREVLETIMKVAIDEDSLYDIFSATGAFGRLRGPMPSDQSSQAIVWTVAMQKLFTLTAVACHFREPLLLVGETGCGKTSVCQVLAAVLGLRLVAVNCHQNMEAADLLGSQRPVRDKIARLQIIAAKFKDLCIREGLPLALPPLLDASWLSESISALTAVSTDPALISILSQLAKDLKGLSAMFEWHDGPLVSAMRDGNLFLLDELSLADDSVLERLNSVLEPARTLVLAEKGGVDLDQNMIIAQPTFGVVATMNPGGDFGKKELSPALRNRFTEVWVPSVNSRADLDLIVQTTWKTPKLAVLGPLILDFLEWFGANVASSADSGIGLRDVLSWVAFSEASCHHTALHLGDIFLHGASLVLIDGLESLPSLAGIGLDRLGVLRRKCIEHALQLCSDQLSGDTQPQNLTSTECIITPHALSIGPYKLERTSTGELQSQPFAIKAPTTLDNLLRVVRACQLPKSILLEGSPGVGKTSLVSALAQLCGRPLCRINLSEQTDLVDLFGADLPVTGGAAGEFAWVDAGFLTAMKRGDWVLLDEMNLASQAVLEGLNAVLDHRGTVFIPELGRSFDRHPAFRVFAAQNPIHQGGGRKGLPKSFLNRFTKVYVREMNRTDLELICAELFPASSSVEREGLITLTEELVDQTSKVHAFGTLGGPWEFNLRDIMRVFALGVQAQAISLPADRLKSYLRLVYVARFRSPQDQAMAQDLSERALGLDLGHQNPWPEQTSHHVQVGHALMIRREDPLRCRHLYHVDIHNLHQQAALMDCLSSRTLAILVGPKGGGKRRTARALVQAIGRPMTEFALHPGADTLEMLGSFEQSSAAGHWQELAHAVLASLEALADRQPMDVSVEAEHYIAQIRGDLVLDAAEQSDAASYRDTLEGDLHQAMQFLRVCASPASYATLASMFHAASAGSAKASFEWVDGPLVKAVREGEVFFISDANLASGSVLDRLNSLCEVGGSLVLSERGTTTEGIPIYRPHPDFRLVLAFDPQHGELSRAMRNRGIEISFMGGTRSAMETPTPEESLSAARIMSCASDESILMLHSASLVSSSGGQMQQSQTAYLLASQNPLSLPFLSRWVAATGSSAASNLLDEYLASGLGRWRDMELAGLPIRESLDDEMTDALPLDFSINPQVAAQSELRMVFLCLQSLAALHSDITHRTPGSMNNRDAAEIRDHLTELSPRMRGWIRSGLSRQLRADARSSELKAFLSVINALFDALHLLEMQLLSETVDFTRTSILILKIRELLKDRDVTEALETVLRKLDVSMRRSAGFGQQQIWIAFAAAHSVTPWLGIEAQLTACLARENLDCKLRASILDLLSTYDDSSQSQNDVLTLLAELSSIKENESNMDTVRLNRPEQGLLLRGRLLLMTDREPQKLHVQAIAGSMLKVTPTTAREWSAVTHRLGVSRSSAAEFRSISNLLMASFSPATSTDDLALHASSAHLPLFSMATAATRQESGTKLADLTQQRLHIDFLSEMLLIAPASGDKTSGQLWRTLGIETVNKIFASFGTASVPAPPKAENELELASQNYLAGISLPPSQVAQEAARTWLDPMRQAGNAMSSQLWVRIGLLLWDLYVPNVPYDPAEEYACSVEYYDTSRERLDCELAIYEAIELSRTGNKTSPAIRSVVADLAEMEAPPPRPLLSREGKSDPRQLNSLFAELQSLQHGILSASGLLSLERKLCDGAKDASAEATSLLASMTATLERLPATYSGLDDLLAPVLLAICALRVGLSLGIGYNRQRSASSRKAALVDLCKKAAIYPAIAASKDLARPVLSGSAASLGVGISQPLHLGLAAIATRVVMGDRVESHLQGILALYDRLYVLSQMDSKKHALQEQAEESMYRRRTKDEEVLSDEAQDEADFKKLFPTYDPDNDDAEQQDAAPATSASTPDEVSTDQTNQVYRLHLSLFGIVGRVTEVESHLWDLRTQLVVESVMSDCDALDNEFDTTAKPLSLGLLAAAKRAFIAIPGDEYSFYTSPNSAEAIRACVLLSRLHTRLESLILEWPEQMVLQHILDRCENMGRLVATSPVARLVPIFEQLLEHIGDWEAYANRDNSLRLYRDQIIDLIVSWRKLELSLWRQILPQQTAAYQLETARWHFRLYEMLVIGMRTLSSENGSINSEGVQAAHIASVHALLNDFVRSSTVGHYKPRLDLLQSFSTMLGYVSRVQVGSEGLLAKRLGDMLVNFLGFYEQYQPTVSAFLVGQQKTLERAVSDYVKLASWKDINVQALKASAHKSHVQLFKLMRKYREVLRQPIEAHLALPEMQPVTFSPDMPARSRDFDLAQPFASACEMRAGEGPTTSGLGDLSIKAKVFHQWSIRLETAIDQNFGADLESVANDIIDRVTSFDLETKALKGEEIKKSAKNLLSRKRRALADVMKELRTIGFSYKVRADSMELQGSTSRMHQIPALRGLVDSDSPLKPMLDRIEQYQHRLEAKMPQLRSSLAQHHADLTTQDLVRLHGMVESVLDFSLSLRSRLYNLLSSIGPLIKAENQVNKLCEHNGDILYVSAAQVEAAVSLALDSTACLLECVERLEDLKTLRPEVFSAGIDGGSLTSHIGSLESQCNSLKQLLGSGVNTAALMLTYDEHSLLNQVCGTVSEAIFQLDKLEVASPQASFLIEPVTSTLKNALASYVPPKSTPAASIAADLEMIDWSRSDTLIQQLLVRLQELSKVFGQAKVENMDAEEVSISIRDFVSKVDRFNEMTRFSNTSASASSLLEYLPSLIPPAVTSSVAELVISTAQPFLSDYVAMGLRNAFHLCQATKAAYKVCHILCTLASDLTTKGFCQPQEEEKGDGEAESGAGAGEATGFGQGTGQDNVTDAIEDESQVEGLQGEAEQDPADKQDGGEKEGDDNAHEMQEDFEGALEDAKDGEAEEGDSEGDDQDQQDMDDHVGDVGEDAVDEQFWSGEQEGKDDEGEAPRDASDGKDEEQQSSEMTAKDGPQEKQKKESKDKKSEGELGDSEEQQEGQEELSEMDDGEEGENDTAGEGEDAQDDRHPDQNHAPEVEPLALTDDLKLDDIHDSASEGDGLSENDNDMQDDDDGMDIDSNEGEETKTGGEAEDSGDPPQDGDEMEQETIGQDDVTQPNETDQTQGSGAGGQQAPQSGESEARGDAEDEKERDGAVDEAEEKGKEGDSDDQPTARQSNPADTDLDDAELAATGDHPEAPDASQAKGENKSFGASLAEVRRLMKEILKQSSEERKDAGAGSAEQQPGSMEHVAEDQDADMEALGAAEEGRQDKLADLQIIDQEEEGGTDRPMDVDEDDFMGGQDQEPFDNRSIPQREETAGDDEAEKALTQAQILGCSKQEAGDEVDPLQTVNDVQDEARAEATNAQIDDAKVEDVVDLSADTLRTSSGPVRNGEELWRKYSALTSDLSFHLCEQMRLILEPTLATRLQGDFRTGKRLNMRKIIPYIASEYTKDKIWLRRTKPSRREYQVLLSLDDSRSMADSQSVHLAYQTMALVSQALSKLEVGQISVARFGDGMEVLHPFGDAGFNARDGAKVMSAFGFEQHRTDVAKLLDSSLEYLQESRRAQSSSSSADLWQLEIIISDGVCQDHPRLRTLLRKAVEQRVMVVFIIVDSLSRSSDTTKTATSTPALSTAPSSRTSILNMQSVSYKSVNGEMKLEMERYLDTFPFEYYVVLRDVQALPEVLSDTLRQWMARVSSSEE